VALLYMGKGSALKPTLREVTMTFEIRFSKAVIREKAPLKSS
jgi:hypothetical protein